MYGQPATMKSTGTERAINITQEGKHEKVIETTFPSPNNVILPIEILQQICLYLDFWSLLRFRHVSRSWRHRIPGSFSPLRKALFLPASQDTKPGANDLQPAMRMHFSIKVEKLVEPGRQSAMDYRIIPIYFASGFEHGSGAAYNPIVKKIDTYTRILAPLGHGSAKTKRPCTEDGMELCEQMFTSSPPVYELEVRCSYMSGNDEASGLFVPDSAEEMILRDAQGVKLGDFVRGLSQMISKVRWEVEVKRPS